MGKRIDKVTGETRYFIPVDGKMYETDEEVYTTYYKMDRRERYLQERSNKKELSYDGLIACDYPVEERLFEPIRPIEDEIVTEMMVEKMLCKLSVLNDYELWLIEELYKFGKSQRTIEKESGVPRRTIAYQKEKILKKLRKELNL